MAIPRSFSLPPPAAPRTPNATGGVLGHKAAVTTTEPLAAKDDQEHPPVTASDMASEETTQSSLRRKDLASRERGVADARPPANLALPEGLLPEKKKLLEDALAGTLGAEAKGALTALLTSPSLKALSPEAQVAALSSFHTAPVGGGMLGGGGGLGGMMGGGKLQPEMRGRLFAQEASALRGFLATPGVKSAPADDQRKLVEIYGSATMGRADLQALAGNPKSPLFAIDSQGTRTIDSLHAMAKGPLHPTIEGQRGWLVASTIEGVKDYEKITQEARGTCTVTSVSQMLAKESPAEYARLVAGLAAPSGKVTLAGGDDIQRVAGTGSFDSSGRNPAERLLQPALMDYGNGALAYDNKRDASLSANRNYGAGLDRLEQRRVMDGVFGKKHMASGQALESRTAAASGKATLFDAALRKGEVLFEKLTYRRDDQAAWSVLQGRSGKDTLTSMMWSDRGNHAVVFEKIENGRVYFRNPQGNAGATSGTMLTDPPRRVENGGARQSMTVEEFSRRAYAVVR